MRLRSFVLIVCILGAITAYFLFQKKQMAESRARETASVNETARPATIPAAETPKPRKDVVSGEAFLPKEIPNERIFNLPRTSSAGKKIKKYLTPRRWEMNGMTYTLMDDVVAIDAAAAPRGVTPVGTTQGLLLFAKMDVENLPVDKYLLLYDERFDNVVVLTGHVKVHTTGQPPALPPSLSIAHAIPHLNLYFVETKATSYAELTEKLALAQSLPGVNSAILGLVESRLIPK